MLMAIDAAPHGLTVGELAERFKVTKRTVWRDMDALQQVGFPLTDDKRDRETTWRLLRMPLKALNDAGLSVTEVCSLYLGRTLVSQFTGTPFEPGLTAIMRRVEQSLSPKVRAFLKRLPDVMHVKPVARKLVTQPKHDEFVARLIEAASNQRVCRVLYFSMHSNREKDYELHPYNLAYADGGLYLTAWVPEYRQVRVFAVERIRRVTLQAATFTQADDLSDGVLGQSLGVNRGHKAERIVVEFTPRVAAYVREREWHPTQKLEPLADGGVRLSMKVCRDWALRSWVLGWGAHARVVAPAALAEEILGQLNEARDGYAPKLAFDSSMAYRKAPAAPRLPLRT